VQAFTVLKGLVVPLDRANVDTDLIIPKQFLKSIKRTGFGPNLFDELRYLDPYDETNPTGSRQVNPDFTKLWLWVESRARRLGFGSVWHQMRHCAELC